MKKQLLTVLAIFIGLFGVIATVVASRLSGNDYILFLVIPFFLVICYYGYHLENQVYGVDDDSEADKGKSNDKKSKKIVQFLWKSIKKGFFVFLYVRE